MHKASLIVMRPAAIGLLAVPLTSASAGDYESGYNRGDTDTLTIGSDPYTDTLTIGSDPYTGGATQDDLKQSHDGAPDGVSPDDSTEADDSSGH